MRLPRSGSICGFRREMTRFIRNGLPRRPARRSRKPPRRSSYEAQLSDSDSLVTTTQIAKEYGCGAKVFNRLLHLHGIQYRANGQWVLYSEHHGKGYTSSLTFRLQRSDGSEVEKLHTAWTQKGRKFLYHTLKRRGVLPLAEQGG